jgi:hypothetical protein
MSKASSLNSYSASSGAFSYFTSSFLDGFSEAFLGSAFVSFFAAFTFSAAFFGFFSAGVVSCFF